MKNSYNRFLVTCMLLSTMISSAHSQAIQSQIDYNGMTITGVGASLDGVAFFNVAEYPAESPAKGCLYGLYYVKLDTPGGRAVYATLLQARAMNKKLVRFDWIRIEEPIRNICYINLVLLQD